MKKIISMLLCFVMLTALCSAALADDVSDVMVVVNCSEWVSLRELPDTASKRLAQVKLGEMVNHCTSASNGFVWCEYQGKGGYIQSKYLKKTCYSNLDDLLVNQMVVNCDEWVSLRAAADTSSQRLAKVPLGAVVTECVRLGSFVQCVYKGQQGYISKDYLTAAEADVLHRDENVVSKYTGKYPTIVNPMTVVNCKEWVSLRMKASDASGRVAKVPLGEIVTNCLQVSDKFIYCRYNGLWGYIQAQYLEELEDEPFWEECVHLEELPPMPEAQELLAVGEPVLYQVLETGNIVIARREQGATKEVLLAVCYDAEMNPLWSAGVTAEEGPTELWKTDAFLGGTESEPVLVLYNAGVGFRAFKVGPWTDLFWECTDPTAERIGGGLVHALDVDGRVYAMGYYVGEMICLDTFTGEHPWSVQLSDMEIYNPFQIEVGETTVGVLFDCIPEDDSMCYEMHVSKANGAKLSLGLRSKP